MTFSYILSFYLSFAIQGVFGIYPLQEGSVEVYGKEKKITSPASAYEKGIAYVSEDRKFNWIITMK